MAVESRIDAGDEWFVGEDRVLRFLFVEGGATTDIASWEMVFQLFARRAQPGDVPLLEVPASGSAATTTLPAEATVVVDGDATLAIGAGVYQFVLSRTDVGSRAVLAFGPAQIRSAVTA